MKQSLFLTLSLIILTSIFSCSKKPISTTTTTTTTTTTSTPTSITTMNKPYTITVVDASPKSPRKEMKAMLDGAAIVINYGSPAVKGREILNNLIPYGKVWRTGANEATTIEISKDIMVEGKKLPAGKYGLFTLNNEGTSQVIFNKTHDQWGAYDYDASKDVLRVRVRPSVSEDKAESMDFRLIGNTLMLVWDTVVIPFDISAS